MKLSFASTLSLTLFLTLKTAAVDSCGPDGRLRGFAEQKRQNAEFQKERERGAEEVKKKREQWNREIEKSVNEYRASRDRQATGIDQSSAAYFEDLKLKKQQEQELEKARREYVRSKQADCAPGSSGLSEMEEYGLNQKDDRVDIAKRTMFGHQVSTSSRGSSRGGSTDFAPPADFGNAPPPPPAPLPEFYEPEVPPPPPPMPSDFEEPIPPPVFEDPDF